MNIILCNKILLTFGCCFLAIMEDDGCKCLFHETRALCKNNLELGNKRVSQPVALHTLGPLLHNDLKACKSKLFLRQSLSASTYYVNRTSLLAWNFIVQTFKLSTQP
jgi:hypothetical protein